MSANARSNARQAGHHPLVEKGARLGYAANGVINIIIGWIALQLALGGGMGGGGAGGSEASASGALRTLAGSTWGSVLLYVVLVGFALLGLWQATSAFLAHETKDRVKAAAKAVVYLGLAGLTYTVINGAGGSGGGTTGATATLMQQPFGQLLVGLVGLGVIAVGLYHVYKGWKKKFLEDLRQNPGHGAVVAGRAGYIARGSPWRSSVACWSWPRSRPTLSRRRAWTRRCRPSSRLRSGRCSWRWSRSASSPTASTPSSVRSTPASEG